MLTTSDGCDARDKKTKSKGLLDTYSPVLIEGENWKEWITQISPTTCAYCLQNNGKIISAKEEFEIMPQVHYGCKCRVEKLSAIKSGTATKDNERGADWWLKHLEKLPDYYISEESLTELGWKNGKTVAKYAPGKMLTKGVYLNIDGKLPEAKGRVWYEADINYYEGKRNRHRIIWSNDGLVFVTYNHYETFYEII